MLIAVLDVEEKICNLKTLFSHPWLRQIFQTNWRTFVSCDLKVSAMLGGIMLGVQPCVFCTWKKSGGWKNFKSVPRTAEHHMKMVEKLETEFDSDGKIGARFCDGVEAGRLLDYNDAIDIFPPPELHMMLGIFQHLYDAAMKNLKPEDKIVHNLALKKLGVSPEKYHGGAFDGHACRKLLQNIERLSFPSKYVEALRALNDVIVSVFGLKRSNDYTEFIEKFIAAYKETNFSVTVKVHLLVEHVVPFVQKHIGNSGLGLLCEQETESSHSKFRVAWKRYSRTPDSPKYGEMLVKCVVDYNFCQLGLKHYIKVD